MFERYTESARRVVFFSRDESSQYGSPEIETEHLLLGIMREDKALIYRFLPNTSIEEMRVKIGQHVTVREKISTDNHLPLSHECRRIFAYATETAERLAHPHIGTEHILMGILSEENCLAARLLVDCGMNLVATRDEIAQSSGDSGAPPPEIPFPPTHRAAIHALVDQLPESELGRAHSMLEQLL